MCKKICHGWKVCELQDIDERHQWQPHYKTHLKLEMPSSFLNTTLEWSGIMDIFIICISEEYFGTAWDPIDARKKKTQAEMFFITPYIFWGKSCKCNLWCGIMFCPPSTLSKEEGCVIVLYGVTAFSLTGKWVLYQYSGKVAIFLDSMQDPLKLFYGDFV